MRPRLFLGNFDFEHRLADPHFQPSKKLRQLNAERACSWLAIAEDGDWLWTPSPISPDFFSEAAGRGLPHVRPVTSLSEVPSRVECVPWGWSNEIRQLVSRFGWQADPPAEAAVLLANSRATSEKLEREWNVGLPLARRIEHVSDLRAAIRELPDSSAGWVIKAMFGMSGRERLLGRGHVNEAAVHWIGRRLKSQGVVFFEPWVERIDEIGIQIHVPPRNQLCQIMGVTPLLVDCRGQYSGSWCLPELPPAGFQSDWWSEAIPLALRAGMYLQSQGYFGPLGIDAMLFQDADGSRRIRPLQDVNARWTMGRLCLGWNRILKPGEHASWQHGDNNFLAIDTTRKLIRDYSTSPTMAGGISCQHSSRLLVYESATEIPVDGTG